ncbi:hypothetical protein BV22DRAFT_1127314 [Leucogyrophana mollusca]|uniref:Uncharacterized protein n=1 Tax=Leucogyrophana mollusca TaxID=85980 RepID=A0ACB8BNP3_9AGAM|nr:hypothetical protein BV22DRAFT_1127314 [Leucogyrophana mollusca]
MPLVTTLIDDKSPLIHYDSSWAPGNSQDDPLADEYYLGTFTTCNVTNGVATFSFNGSAFWIYGAKRSNHGSYTVDVDGGTFNDNGDSSNAIFQTSLFNQSLSQGEHTVTLTNTGQNNLYVDIDLIVWQSEVGQDEDQLMTETVEDTDPRFSYQEPAWTSSPGDPTTANFFSNGTGHSTTNYDAYVTFTFTVMLYHADNLGSGQHQVVLTNLPNVAGQYLNIDYATLTTLSSNNSTSGGEPPGPSSNNANVSSGGIGSGAIAGIVVALVVAVAAGAAAFVFYRRWRAAQAAQQDLYRVYTPQQAPAAGISSSIETRSNASLVRNETSSNATSGRSYQQSDYGYQAAQYNDHVRNLSGTTNDSRLPTLSEVADILVTSPVRSPVDETARRPLPGTPNIPGQGYSSSAELAKLAAIRRAEDGETATIRSELPPPNYGQAVGSSHGR